MSVPVSKQRSLQTDLAFKQMASTVPHNGIEHQSNVTRVSIRLMFLRIGEIDTLNEKYQAQASIEARWPVDFETLAPSLSPVDRASLTDGKSVSLVKYADTHWHPRLFIENALGELKEQVTHSAKRAFDQRIYICEQRDIKGLFWEKLELYHFPSDVQELSISVGSMYFDDHVILISDPDHPSGINREAFVDQQEWSLYEHVDTEQRFVKEFLFQNADEEETQMNRKSERQRSFLSVSCRAARQSAYFYWNGYFLVFLITICAFCGFAITANLPHFRIQMTVTLLLTSITFRWTVNRSLPTVSYLTSLDKYAIISIVILIILCVWHAIIGASMFINMHFASIDTHDRYVWIDRYLFFTLFGLYWLMHLAMLVWLYQVPLGYRRQMAQKDVEFQNRSRSQLITGGKAVGSTFDVSTMGSKRNTDVYAKTVKGN